MRRSRAISCGKVKDERLRLKVTDFINRERPQELYSVEIIPAGNVTVSQNFTCYGEEQSEDEDLSDSEDELARLKRLEKEQPRIKKSKEHRAIVKAYRDTLEKHNALEDLYDV